MTAEPILVHMHIPKCAGQWLDAVLWRLFPSPMRPLRRRDRVLLLEDRKYRANIEAFEATLRANPQAAAISSQKFMHGFPEMLAGRPARYAAIFRDPGEQFLSFVRFTLKGFGSFKEGFQSNLPPELAGMPLPDAVRLLIRIKPGLVTHFLPAKYLSATLDEAEAMENLGRLHFVDTIEKARSLAIRIARFARPDEPPETFLPEKRVNTTERRPDEETAAAALDEFHEYLGWPAVRLSRTLYEHVRDASAAAAGSAS